MNIMNRLTWKSMVKNRTRTVITAIGIALSAALFCAVTTLGASIFSYLIDLQIATGGDYHVSATVLTEEKAEEILSHEEVKSAAHAEILGMMNLYKQEMGPNSGMVKACSTQYFTSMPGFSHIEGRPPENSTELVIGEYLLHTMEAKGYPIALGSKVTLPVTPFVQDMGQGDPAAQNLTVTGTIVGILPFEYDITLPHEAGTYSHIYMGLDDNTPDPLYCDLFLKADNPYGAQALAKAVGGNANYSLLRYYGISAANNVTLVIWGLMATIIAIVLIGTVSLISNAFSISVAQRTQEFGLLSSVGATKKQLRRSVHFEAGLLCLFSIPLGLLLGFFSAKILLDSSADTVESMLAVSKTGVALKVVANPVAILGAAAIGAAAVFLSAWIPASQAAKVSPVAAIRRETEYQPEKKSQKVARKWWNPRRISANMAGKYYRVNRKKYRPIMTALSISVVLFLSAMAVSSSLQFVSDSFEMENFDFQVSIHNWDEALLKEIRNHDSVAQSVLYDNERFYTLIPDEYESQQRKDAFDTDDPVDLQIAQDWKDGATSVYYLEDDAFRAYLQEQGVDPAPYFDQENPLVAVFYQQWHYVGQTEEGDYDWIYFTFPPLSEDAKELRFLPDTPDVGEYTAQQIKAQGYSDSISDRREFALLPDGSILFRQYAQGCSMKPHSGGIYEIIPEGEVQIFSFLAVEEMNAENLPVIRYYTYDEETGAAGNAVIAETPGGMETVSIGAQIEGIPFGIPGNVDVAWQLTMLRPLSMADQDLGLPALSIRTNNYPATKAYLESLAEDDSKLVYNDYLGEQYQMRQVSNLVNLFATAFVAAMTLICVANIFNIVSTNILLRRRDIGMLRSMGMTNRSIAAMTAREYLSCGLRSICWGLPAGIVLMLAIKILLGNMINGGNEIPWWAVAVAATTVFAVVGSSIVYALIRTRKDNPIDAIRMENT